MKRTLQAGTTYLICCSYQSTLIGAVLVKNFGGSMVILACLLHLSFSRTHTVFSYFAIICTYSRHTFSMHMQIIIIYLSLNITIFARKYSCKDKSIVKLRSSRFSKPELKLAVHVGNIKYLMGRCSRGTAMDPTHHNNQMQLCVVMVHCV